MDSVEIFQADQLRPNPWLPQRKQYPLHVLVDETAYEALRNERLAIYAAQVTLGAQQAGRTTVIVEPGFSLCMITGFSSAAAPADGLGAAQLIMYDPARRLSFSRIPVVQGNIFGRVGAGAAPFMLRSPYKWTGGSKAPIQIQIQNRAAAQNTITLLLIGREP